jgi:hypothetical protein
VTAHQLFTDFKKAYDSARRKLLYNILIECGNPMKLVMMIKMCLNEKSSGAQLVASQAALSSTEY